MAQKIKSLFLIILFLLILECRISAAGTAVSHLLNYQGRVMDKTGKYLEGNYKMTFRIYDSEAAGNLLWEEIHPNVFMQKGYLEIFLGSITALNLNFDKQYFLEVKVGQDVMRPRQRITSVGYALKAEVVEKSLHAQLADKAAVADNIKDPTFLIPKGGIILSKTSCPAGYKRVGELDGKFLAAGATYNASSGGSNTKALSINNLPSHGHDVSHYGHGMPVIAGSGSQKAGIFNPGLSSKLDSKFIISYSGETVETGSGQPFDIRPEFSSLVLCEKD